MSEAIFVEGDYVFDFSKARIALKADSETRPIGHLSAVDFIVQDDENNLFIEVKDLSKKQEFLELHDAKSALFKLELRDKFYATLLSEFTSNKLYDNLFYCIILGGKTFPQSLVSHLETSLNSALPAYLHQNASIPSPFIKKVKVFTIIQWNAKFPSYPVSTTPPVNRAQPR